MIIHLKDFMQMLVEKTVTNAPPQLKPTELETEMWDGK